MNINIKTHLIDEYLKNNKLSVSDFCKQCKISPAIYNRFFENNSHFSIKYLYNISKILNIRILDLIESK